MEFLSCCGPLYIPESHFQSFHVVCPLPLLQRHETPQEILKLDVYEVYLFISCSKT